MRNRVKGDGVALLHAGEGKIASLASYLLP